MQQSLRWPGQIQPGSVSNEIMHHMDWLPTFAAAAGQQDIKDKLLQGYKAGPMSYKGHCCKKLRSHNT